MPALPFALPSVLVGVLAADIGFVDFNHLVCAAETAGKGALAHGFANAVHHEPGRFVRNADHAVHLMRAHPLLAGAQQERRHQPLVKRDMRALKEGADRDRELLAARIALIPAGPRADRRRFAYGAAMAANRIAVPQLSLKPLARLGFVVERSVGELICLRHDRRLPRLVEAFYQVALLSQGDNCLNFYKQGMDSLTRKNFDAAGTMFRKSLDAGLRQIDPDGKGTLEKRINALPSETGITPPMKGWAHEIRHLGNDAAHEDEPFTDGEAKSLQSFTELFLTYAFTLPGMLAARHPTEGTDGEGAA